MVARLNPYISFTGNAREAMEFYQSIFGGSLTMNTFAEFGDTDGVEYADQIMHAMLETDTGLTLMGADSPPEMKTVVPGDNIVISLSGDSADELHRYWDQLSASGKVDTPLAKQIWGDEYGSCQDKFGISWMVNIAQPKA